MDYLIVVAVIVFILTALSYQRSRILYLQKQLDITRSKNKRIYDELIQADQEINDLMEREYDYAEWGLRAGYEGAYDGWTWKELVHWLEDEFYDVPVVEQPKVKYTIKPKESPVKKGK